MEEDDDFDALAYFKSTLEAGNVDEAPTADGINNDLNEVTPASVADGNSPSIEQQNQVEAAAKFTSFDVGRMAQEILGKWYDSVENIFEVADILCQYEALLDDAQTSQLHSAINFSPSWFTMMRVIDREADNRFKNPEVRKRLPPAYSVIYRLAKLPQPVFEAALKDGLIEPEMTREDADKLRDKPPSSTAQGQRNIIRFLIADTEWTDRQDKELDALLGPICTQLSVRCVAPKRRTKPAAGANL